MKLHLPLRLLSSLLALVALASTATPAAADYTPTADLGNVMYVGDSITHGVGAASYRWALFKILADNGIGQTEVGNKTGNYTGGVAAGTRYGDSVFDNRHAAVSAQCAYNFTGHENYYAGRDENGTITNASTIGNRPNRMGTGVTLESILTSTASQGTPDAFFLMIGTNDILSDLKSTTNANTTSINISEAQTTIYPGTDQAQLVDSFELIQGNLIGQYNEETGRWEQVGDYKPDMDILVDTMRASNPNAQIIVTTLPTWSSEHSNNNTDADYELIIGTYNENLKSWGLQNADKGVVVVDVNVGLIDVASESGLSGLSKADMYRGGTDGLHPNAQGDLIIAGNIAKQLGYAGRTAGQERVAAAAFEHQVAGMVDAASLQGDVALSGSTLTLGNDASLFWATDADLSNGYTVDFSLAGSWDALGNQLSSALGNGATDGWATDAFFSISLSDGTTSGTLSISESYIQWGDRILYSTDASTLTESLRLAYVQGNAAQGLESGYYVWMGDMLIGEALTGSASDMEHKGLTLSNGTGNTLAIGNLAFDSTDSWAPTTTLYTTENPQLIEPWVAPEGSGEGTVAWKTEGFTNTLAPTGIASNVSNLRARADNSSGAAGREVSLTFNSGSAGSGFTVNGSAYEGNIWVTMTGTAASAKGNVLNAAALKGDMNFRVDSSYVGTSSWTGITAAYNNGSIDGNLYMEFSSSYYKMTGALSAAYGASITGKVTMVFNDGTFGGVITGGSASGTNAQTIGGTELYLNKGTFSGNIYGGNSGSAAANISGNTHIHITGDGAVFESSVGIICAGNNKNGVISGNSIITLSNLTDEGTFHSYAGYLAGGVKSTTAGTQGDRILNFENVQLSSMGATLNQFDVVNVTDNSTLGLTGLGGATRLTVDGGSTLRLLNAASGGTVYNMTSVGNSGGIISVGEKVTLAMNDAGDPQTSGLYKVEGGTLDFKGSATNSSVQVSSGTLKNTAGVVGGIAINATGNVVLSGVDAAQITELNTLTASQVSGLSGELSLAEATLALSADMNSPTGAALQMDSGVISITESLTLNLDGSLSELLAAQVPGEQAAPLSITLTGEVDPLSQALILSTGKLEVDASQVTISLAEGYEDYTVTATDVVYDEAENYTYVTYSVTKTIPEPATATLSLLALTALAARRRRRG